MNIKPIKSRGPSPTERLREIIKHSGMTSHEISARSGVNPSVLSRFMNGVTSLSFANFDKIAPVLRIRLISGATKH